jgi:hypothetical protein
MLRNIAKTVGSTMAALCLVATLAMAQAQRPSLAQTGTTLRAGRYTIQQKSNDRYVDAYINKKDFALMTRPSGDYQPKLGNLFVPPIWVITPVGGGAYTIQHKESGRFMDAHEIVEKDYAIITRPQQNNHTQQWILTPLGDNTYTIQQKSSGRFVDAHEIKEKDYTLVTRPAQNNDTQRWIIRKFVPEG